MEVLICLYRVIFIMIIVDMGASQSFNAIHQSRSCG